MSPFSTPKILYTVQPGDSLHTLAKRYNTTVQEIISANPETNLGTIFTGQGIFIRPGNTRKASESPPRPAGITQSELDLRNHLRVLWEQHITWTRLAIISMVFNLPDVVPVTNRLLRNPKDFEAALVPLYGPETASRFARLLTDHLALASQLVKAAKAGDSRTANETEKLWYQNARDIAAFLAGINPYWSYNEWEKMMFDHLALVKKEAVDMMNQNFQQEIDLYDDMERLAMMMAYVMAEGIIKQFPENF